MCGSPHEHDSDVWTTLHVSRQTLDMDLEYTLIRTVCLVRLLPCNSTWLLCSCTNLSCLHPAHHLMMCSQLHSRASRFPTIFCIFLTAGVVTVFAWCKFSASTTFSRCQLSGMYSIPLSFLTIFLCTKTHYIQRSLDCPIMMCFVSKCFFVIIFSHSSLSLGPPVMKASPWTTIQIPVCVQTDVLEALWHTRLPACGRIMRAYSDTLNRPCSRYPSFHVSSIHTRDSHHSTSQAALRHPLLLCTERESTLC